MKAAHFGQAIRHLVLQPLEQVTNVLVVDVERAAVDVRPLSQLPDGDGLGGLFGHEIHQSLPQLLFRFSDATIYILIFHRVRLRIHKTCTVPDSVSILSQIPRGHKGIFRSGRQILNDAVRA